MVRRAHYHHGNLREALIAAALALLGERGAVALSLREVARRAGVSHAAPYRHFDDRAALLAALAEHGHAELERRLACERSLPAAAAAYVSYALENRALFQLMFDADVLAPPALRASLARAIAPLTEDPLVWPAVHGLAVLTAERLLDCEPREAALGALFDHSSSMRKTRPPSNVIT